MNLNWNELEKDDLPADLEVIANELNLNVVRYLVETFGGGNLYIPALSKLRRQQRDRLLRQSYDGTNERELSIKFDITRRQLKEILRNNPDG